METSWFLEVLACPSCHRRLVPEADDCLRCPECQRQFGIDSKGTVDVRLNEPDELPAPHQSPDIGAAAPVRFFNRVRKGADRRLRPRLYALGNKVECPYCGWHGSQFLPSGEEQMPNRLCPQCGSVERYRSLLLYLKQETGLGQRPLRLLDIAARGCFGHFCRQSGVEYLSSDLMTPGAMVFSDLTRMGVADDAFDVIVCLHVMEHIPDDIAAYTEMHRIMKPDGFAIVVVPIKSEKTFEDPDARPEDYKCLYGQDDHVRIYGMDIVERMQKADLNVEIIDIFEFFPPEILQRYALYGDDRYFFRLSRAQG